MSIYRSCHSIEGELFFNHLNRVGYCCMITPCGGQPILYRDYMGELINWDEFFDNREKHIGLMKNGGELEACKDCFWIRDKEWPERKREFRYILINVWIKCNLKCIYCETHCNYGVNKYTKEYDISAVIKDMIEKKVITPNTKIDIAGGEATIDKNFNSMLAMLVSEGIKNINISTNSTIYVPIISEGIHKGYVSIITSIDCGSKDKFLYIKKKDLWAKTWKNIKKYCSKLDKKHNSNTIKTKFIIIPGVNDTIEEIRNFVILSKKAKVSGVILNIDKNWEVDNSCNADDVLKIFRLTKYFVRICHLLNLDWDVWAHLEDLFLRHNKAHAEIAVDLNFIYNKEVNFKIENENLEKLILTLKYLF